MDRDSRNCPIMRVRCYIFLTTGDWQPRNVGERNPVWIEWGNMRENESNSWFGYEKARVELIFAWRRSRARIKEDSFLADILLESPGTTL